MTITDFGHDYEPVRRRKTKADERLDRMFEEGRFGQSNIGQKQPKNPS